jgi:predicted aspartyl protease
MKRSQLTWVVILGAGILTLAVFRHAAAQTQPAAPQEPEKVEATSRFTSGNSALKIPLEIDNNLLLLRVSVNGSKPLRFIFDTGASHSGIDAKRATELGLKTEGQATGMATGGPIEGTFIRGVSFKVPGAEVSNQVIFSMAFPTVPGFEFDGVIGYDFINQFVIEIDYLNKFMNLYNPQTYVYRGKEKPIPLMFYGGRDPFVVTKIVLEGRAPIEATLEVDTGADGTFVISGRFVEKHQLLTAIPNTVKDRGRGAGGEERRTLGQVKAAHIGRFVMKDPPLALSLHTDGSDGKDKDGVVGGEIFRRFKLIIDYRHQRMFLEPNKSFNEPYHLETEG